jgi:hypothetical protein
MSLMPRKNQFVYLALFLCSNFGSNIRQVPDNQEVFISSDSDLSFIVEILQSVSESDDLVAARCFLILFWLLMI